MTTRQPRRRACASPQPALGRLAAPDRAGAPATARRRAGRPIRPHRSAARATQRAPSLSATSVSRRRRLPGHATHPTRRPRRPQSGLYANALVRHALVVLGVPIYAHEAQTQLRDGTLSGGHFLAHQVLACESVNCATTAERRKFTGWSHSPSSGEPSHPRVRNAGRRDTGTHRAAAQAEHSHRVHICLATSESAPPAGFEPATFGLEALQG